ncbi:MAG TPA: nuclear transport factor 2 family protein [Thermoanaerobaculia bacterium]|nr:nuclear transport factor 2 family protein [Thermoanaerobaculia bacterium]
MIIKALRSTCFAIGAAVLLTAGTVASAQTAGPAATKELFEEIAGKDRMLFDAVFNTCDVQALSGLVTDDFEMYHDKGGLVATSGAQFVENIRGMCERQKTGEDYRARRELVEGSLEVYPLNNYGAVEVGVHRFYKKTEGQPDKLVEIAKFTQVWKKDASGWKLARVLSYDHKLTE